MFASDCIYTPYVYEEKVVRVLLGSETLIKIYCTFSEISAMHAKGKEYVRVKNQQILWK